MTYHEEIDQIEAQRAELIGEAMRAERDAKRLRIAAKHLANARKSIERAHWAIYDHTPKVMRRSIGAKSVSNG